MKKSIFILAAVALLAMVSCNNKAKENQNQESAATVALSVDDILAKGDSLVGKTVTVEGVCTHICKHGGKKLFMMGTDDTKMLRAEACELGSFPAEVVNSLVSVTGTLEEDRIDEATIQRMEEQYKNQSGEKHGDGEAGCESEKKAAGQAVVAQHAEVRLGFDCVNNAGGGAELHVGHRQGNDALGGLIALGVLHDAVLSGAADGRIAVNNRFKIVFHRAFSFSKSIYG